MKTALVVAAVVCCWWAVEAIRGRLDPLLQARCDAQCWSLEKPNRTECRSRCSKESRKAGSCPTSARSGGWESACVKACARDAHCSGTARCCRHDCGATCQEPPDLLVLTGLPAIPTNVTARERRRAVRVSWSAEDVLPGTLSSRVLYVLEEQHHVGPKYEEGRLGEWNMVHRTQRTNTSLKNIIKGGRWYRFRVAAVAASGTRGYSEPSPAFAPRLGPRAPAAPRGLRAVRLRARNSGRRPGLAALLKWRAPASDLPVAKYKVYWSRRLKGIDDDELDSVYVKHRTVGRDQTQFELTDLQPNSMYFLQVQALSQYGLAKLRSEKASIVLNTTSYKNETGTSNKTYSKRKVEGLKLRKMFWKNDQLYAHIGWNSPQDKREQKYLVQWWTGPCRGENKDVRTRKQLATMTSLSQLDLDELEFECTYTVFVSRVPTRRSTADGRAALAFTVPSCTQLQSRYKSMQNIKCPT